MRCLCGNGDDPASSQPQVKFDFDRRQTTSDIGLRLLCTTMKTVTLLAVLAASATEGFPATAICFDCDGSLDSAQCDLLDTLQGLVNRSGPRLMLGYSCPTWGDCWWNTGQEANSSAEDAVHTG